MFISEFKPEDGHHEAILSLTEDGPKLFRLRCVLTAHGYYQPILRYYHNGFLIYDGNPDHLKQCKAKVLKLAMNHLKVENYQIKTVIEHWIHELED